MTRYHYNSTAAVREARRRREFERLLQTIDPETQKVVKAMIHDIYNGIVGKKSPDASAGTRPVSPMFAKVYAIELTMAILSRPELDPLILSVTRT